MEWKGRELKLEKIRSVFCRDQFFPKCPIDPDTHQHLRYAEIQAGVEGVLKVLSGRTYWINDPWSMEVADNKIFQIKQAKEYGLQVPRTLVTDKPELLRWFWKDCGRHVIIKQISDISLVDCSEQAWDRDGPSEKETAGLWIVYRRSLRERHHRR